VAALLQELGEEDLEERLTSAGRSPAQPAHRLAQLIADVVPTGRPVLVLELSRGPGVASSAALGELAAAALVAGADALAVKTDSEDTPEPLKDVLAATQAAAAAFERQRPPPRANPFAGPEPAPAPVLQRDWFLHPIQVVSAKEAGAAGILGVIASVTSRGTPLMSSFAASIGLDCPVEIVNMQELQAMERFRVPFFAMNLSVGLSVQLQGFGLQVASGLLGEMPFGSISMVGASSIEDARKARQAGADSILIKWELVQQYAGDHSRLAQLLEELRYATSGDD
jgi:indole-3-glycerol phosphate synthase